MNKGLRRLLLALAVELACAWALAAYSQRSANAFFASWFISLPLLAAVTGTLILLLFRLAEDGAARSATRAARAACWAAFILIGLPLSLLIAFMACCSPLTGLTPGG